MEDARKRLGAVVRSFQEKDLVIMSHPNRNPSVIVEDKPIKQEIIEDVQQYLKEHKDWLTTDELSILTALDNAYQQFKKLPTQSKIENSFYQLYHLMMMLLIKRVSEDKNNGHAEICDGIFIERLEQDQKYFGGCSS